LREQFPQRDRRGRTPRVTNGKVATSRARLQDGHEAPVPSRPRTHAGARILRTHVHGSSGAARGAEVARNLPRRARPAIRGDHPPWFSSARTHSCQSHSPVRPAVLLSPILPPRRRCGCRLNAARRLLDDLQTQLTRLPPRTVLVDRFPSNIPLWPMGALSAACDGAGNAIDLASRCLALRTSVGSPCRVVVAGTVTSTTDLAAQPHRLPLNCRGTMGMRRSGRTSGDGPDERTGGERRGDRIG